MQSESSTPGGGGAHADDGPVSKMGKQEIFMMTKDFKFFT